MRKALSNPLSLLAIAGFIVLTLLGLVAYGQASTVCSGAAASCALKETEPANEMLWDVLSQQFVSAVRLR